MKQIISVFLLVIMLFAIGSSCAFAEDTSVEETLLSDVWMFTSESASGMYIQFYPDGSGSASGTLIEWTITDFGIRIVATYMGQQSIAVYTLEEIDGIPTLVLSIDENSKLVRRMDLDSAEDTDTAAEDNGMADAVADEDNTASAEETVREVVVFANDYPMLGVGSRGDEVKAVQEALIEQGFLQGSADGIYGNGQVGAEALPRPAQQTVKGLLLRPGPQVVYGHVHRRLGRGVVNHTAVELFHYGGQIHHVHAHQGGADIIMDIRVHRETPQKTQISARKFHAGANAQIL